MEKILLTQFIAHLIADFFAQPECVSRRKQEYIFRSWHLYIHALTVFAASVAMTPTFGFVLWAGAIAVLHLGIDTAKSVLRYGKTNEAEYVLIGTLMGFAVAFILGVGITSGVFENVINIISL